MVGERKKDCRVRSFSKYGRDQPEYAVGNERVPIWADRWNTYSSIQVSSRVNGLTLGTTSCHSVSLPGQCDDVISARFIGWNGGRVIEHNASRFESLPWSSETFQLCAMVCSRIIWYFRWTSFFDRMRNTWHRIWPICRYLDEEVVIE